MTHLESRYRVRIPLKDFKRIYYSKSHNWVTAWGVLPIDFGRFKTYRNTLNIAVL